MLLLAVVAAGCDRPRSPAVPVPSTREPGSAEPAARRPELPPPATSPTCPAAPPWAEPQTDRPRYELTVELSLADNTVKGTTAVRFTPDLDTDRLVFRLWPNGPRSAQAGGSLSPGEVTVDGTAVPATREDPTVLVVRPGGTLARGRTIEARLAWTLTLPRGVPDRVSREGDAVRLGSFFPILPWEPGGGWNTEPAVGAFAEASTSPVADFDVTVAVPAGLTVLATGVNDRPGHWTATAMRDFAVSAGRFTLARGRARTPGPVEVTVGAHEGTGEAPEVYLGPVIAALEDFSRRYGPYPWPTFSLAITPNVGGGIEYPGHVMQSPGTSGSITPHEVAHQWFYAVVGNNQGRDPWLDESLASWAEARFDDAIAEYQAVPIAPEAAGRLGESMTYWAAREDVYPEGVYIQGVQALAALGRPELVDCALRVYAAVNAYGIARQNDLLRALSTAFPDAPRVLGGYGVRA